MSSISSVTIDASVLAVPDITCTKDCVYNYVKTLLDCGKLIKEPWAAICMSKRASKSLDDDGLYPLRKMLKNLFRVHGIIEYDVNTVSKFIEHLLRITPHFEDYYHVEDVLWSDLKTKPDIINLIKAKGLKSDLERCVTLIAILRKHSSLPIGGHLLVLRKAPDRLIQVKVHIEYIEHCRSDIPDLPNPLGFFEGDVLVCDDFYGLIECIDESAILTGAPDDIGIELAIQIALFKHTYRQGGSPEWGEDIVPSLGSKFQETCQKICEDQGQSMPSRILRSIVETVNGENLSAEHALRTGLGGNDPQRTRGSDRAYRRDIDRDVHLHYWKCDDGRIELASVVYHNNFSIPE